LESVPGVAEVATVGGFVKQYQVNVDPNKLRAYGMSINQLMQVIQDSNSEVGGRVVEFTGKEYLVRGRGYIQAVSDIEKLPLGTDGKGTPILISDVAHVELGPDMRRGVAEFNGEGEVTGGIVVVRYGQNVMNVIQAVKQKIEEVRSGLPKGVDFVVTYDRSDLIERSIDTLKHTLIEELIIVSVVILIFLWHVPSAVIPIVTIPIAVILSFIPMYGSGVTSNIMSLGGISMAIAAVLAITLDPAMRLLFMRTQPFAFRPRWLARMTNAVLVGRIHSEENHPISRPLMRIYHPVVRFVLNHKWLVITAAMILVALTVPVYLQLGSEFMPPLNEGTMLYMPITLPGISVTEATKYLQIQDKLLMQFPEVQSVFGKIGKSETATDPAPMSMVETTVVLKPESEWRKAHRDRWYTGRVPEFLKPALRRFWPEDGPIDWEQLIGEMDRMVQIPSFV